MPTVDSHLVIYKITSDVESTSTHSTDASQHWHIKYRANSFIMQCVRLYHIIYDRCHASGNHPQNLRYALHCHLGPIVFMSISSVTHPTLGGSSMEAAVHQACQNMNVRAEQTQKGPFETTALWAARTALQIPAALCVKHLHASSLAEGCHMSVAKPLCLLGPSAHVWFKGSAILLASMAGKISAHTGYCTPTDCAFICIADIP